jgi:ATPase subunit of ABC transporter with duplicated ATPase domains
MPAKVVLAYKYGLDEYIVSGLWIEKLATLPINSHCVKISHQNTFVQNMDTIEEIKSTLAKEYDGGLPEEFKQMLQRKLAMMEKEEAKLRAKRKAKRKEWKQKHHEAEKVKKKKRKEAKEERRKERPKKEDNKTAEKDEVMKSSSSAAKRNMKKAEDGVKKMKIGP